MAAGKPKISADGKTMTVTAPAETSGAPVDVKVAVPGFLTLSLGTGVYTFVDTAAVAPHVAQAGDTVSVTGDFSQMTTPVPYLSTDGGLTGTACGNPQVVSDTQITCDLGGSQAVGAYSVIVQDRPTQSTPGTFDTTAVTSTLVTTVASSLSTLTVADF